jgi:hypothetical protein
LWRLLFFARFAFFEQPVTAIFVVVLISERERERE